MESTLVYGAKVKVLWSLELREHSDLWINIMKNLWQPVVNKETMMNYKNVTSG